MDAKSKQKKEKKKGILFFFDKSNPFIETYMSTGPIWVFDPHGIIHLILS